MPDVVVPVFNAAEELRDCIAALDRTVPSDVRITLIDDASTEPGVAKIFRELAKRGGRWRLMRNPRNLGFVQTANRAMVACHGDVVLLNSDTVPAAGWLERIVACADSDETIATVTPLTNNGEICSFPVFCTDNPAPEDPDRVAEAMTEAGPPTYPDLPTAVGFCTFIRRRALNALGLFDPRFGMGYGEENDFSRRAARAGWRNVCCDDAYVVHLGQRSFRHHKLQPKNESSMARLRERYPDYEQIVADFIRRDPLAARRRAIMEALGEVGRRETGDGGRKMDPG